MLHKKKIESDFYNADYYAMQTSKELTERTLPFVLTIPVERKIVLEIGCGSGQYLQLIQESATLSLGFDYSKDALRICREKGLTNVFLATAGRIPIRKTIFDVIMLIDVVEHLYPDQFKNCAEDVSRILKPKGIVAIKTPYADIIPDFVRKLYNQILKFPPHQRGEGHVNEMTVDQVIRPFKKKGFRVQQLTITNLSRHPTFNKIIGYRLGGNMTIILEKK